MWVYEPTHLTYQPMVGRARFEFVWLANKWAGLGCSLSDQPMVGRAGSGRVTRFDSSS